MKVLVTGASGMIGAALCRALLERGDEVVGLTRDPGRARRRQAGVEWHPWQPALERPPAAALAEVDAVVNLAGEPIDQRWTDSAKRRIRESRSGATGNLVDAILALDRKPQAFVSQSAIGYYGDRGAEPLAESAAPGGDFAASVVVDWEAAARRLEDSEVRLAIIRTGHVLAREGGFLGRLLPPFRLGIGGPIAGGGQYVSWIHVDDEIDLLLRAIDDQDVSGPLNATAPHPVTNKQLAKALGRAVHRPALIPVPGLALDLMFGRELATVLKGGQRVIPERALELGYEFRHSELEEALRDLV